MFFKEIILDGTLGKIKYYAIRTEFQKGGSPRVHSFISILNAPNIENQAVYMEFVEKTINAQLPGHLNNLELFTLEKTYQVYAHTRTCWKYSRNECHFPYGRYFTKKTIIAKPLDSKFSNHEKQELLTWRNTLLRKVNNYIDNDRNPAKVNVVDPTKHNFTQP